MQQPASDTAERFDVFISYSRKDTRFVAHLERALEAYKAPASLGLARRRLNVFRDAEDLIGPDYNQSIRDCLGRSNKLLVVCSPNARASQYVDQEIELFLETHPPGDVIALLLAGAPNNEVAADDERRAFPPQLCKAHAMPLAADYRGFDVAKHKAHKAPYEGPWFTSLANIFGLDRSTLEQRERQKQRRERRIVATIAGSVMLGLATAAVFSWVQMRRAEEQRNVAVKGFSRYLAMNSEQVADPETSLLLAVEAARATHDLDGTVTADAESALRTALSRTGGIRLGIGTRGLSFSADKRWLAEMQDDGSISVWDLNAKATQPSTADLQVPLASVQAGPANRLAAISKDRSRIAVLDMTDLKRAPRWIESKSPPIGSICFSADGTKLLVTDRSADLLVSDLAHPETEWTRLRGHTLKRTNEGAQGLREVNASSGGRWMATAGHDDTLVLWDGQSAAATPQQLLSHIQASNVQFSSDDRWLHVSKYEPATPGVPSATRDVFWLLGESQARQISVDTRSIADGPQPVPLTSDSIAKFMPGDRYIVRRGGTTLLWKLDAEGATLERRIDETLASVDGEYFLTIGVSGLTHRFTVWRIGEEESVASESHDMTDKIHNVVFSDRARTLAVFTDRELLTWRLNGDRFADGPIVYAGADGDINKLEIAPDGRVVVANWYRAARLWDLSNPSLDPVRLDTVDTRTELREDTTSGGSGGQPIGGMQQLLAFNAQKNLVAFPVDSRGLGIVSLQRPNDSPIELRIPGEEGNSDSNVSAIAFSDDGTLLAAADRKFHVRVWRTDKLENPLAVLRFPETEVRTSSLSALSFSGSGRYLAAANAFGSIAVWALATPREAPRRFTPHQGWVTSLGFSADERHLLTGGEDGKGALIALAGHDSTRILEGHTGPVRAAFTSTDKIVTFGKDATIRVWGRDSPSTAPIVLRGHNDEITTLASIPGSRKLVTVSVESMRVWDLSQPEQSPHTLLAREPIGMISISHDGRWLAAASSAGVDLRRTDSLDEAPLRLPAPSPHPIELFALQFSPDDRWLAGLSPGQGWLWRTQPEALMQVACDAAGRNFNPDKWEQYLSDVPYRFTCSQWGLGPGYMQYARDTAEATATEHATRLFARARELDPSLTFDPAAEAKRLGVARVLKDARHNTRRGYTEDALMQLTRVREIDPALVIDPKTVVAQVKQASDLVIKGTTRAKAGSIDDAVATYKEALALDPDLIEPGTTDTDAYLDPVRYANERYAETLAQQGLTLAADGKLQDAEAKFEHALRFDPKVILTTPEEEAKFARANALRSQGDLLAERGDLEGAESLYRDALVADDTLKFDPMLEARRKIAIYWMKKADERDAPASDAIAHFSKALTFDPRPPIDLYSTNVLCERALREGLAKQGMIVCDTAVARDANGTKARHQRGAARALTGNARGAIEDFEVVIKTSTDTTSNEKHRQWIQRLKAGWRPKAYAEVSEE